jgi:hypothetical protein
LARAQVTKSEIKPTTTTNGVIAPQSSNPHFELYYMLGILRGANVDGSVRIAELVNQLLSPAAPEQTGSE